MKINFTNQQSDLTIDLYLIDRIVKEVLSQEEASCDELGVFFVEANKICELHEEFFDDPSLTDCISFPIDIDMDEQDTYRVLGDVFICPFTAIEYATSVGKDPYHECTLYLVHGLLHLLGYDDIQSDDRQKMREAEKRVMDHLQNQGLLLKEERQHLHILH